MTPCCASSSYFSWPSSSSSTRRRPRILLQHLPPPSIAAIPIPSITSRLRDSTMAKAKAIRVHELGGPEVMRWEEVEVGAPKDGEIRIRTTAIGVNFIDVYFRKGVYAAPAMPFTPGMEAVGVVTAVGPGLTGRKVGDVVAYAGNPMGSYAQEQILPASVAVPVPPSVDHKQAASVMLKGMTAHVLLRRVFKVQSGHTVLVHAAAGGVGSLLCQWANALGATVIGTVSNDEKAAQATQDGCHHVIIYTREDVATRVKEITSGKGVNVVYDSVGKDTYKASVECLASRGFLVSFGQSSGKPDPIPMSDLASKSLFLTRPSLMHYTSTRDELLESAGEVFANVANGVLRVRVNHTYPLSEAARAHADLEGRKTLGSIVLIPEMPDEQANSHQQAKMSCVISFSSAASLRVPRRLPTPSAAAAAASSRREKRMQRVVVMRHGDRLDQAEPIWPANKPRPWDPPLTNVGLLRAWTVGKRIRAAAAADGWAVHRVLVSPFLRCRQTAARAAAALCAVPDDAALLAIEDAANVPLDTSRLKVSIEYGLSEMMNTQAMGSIVGRVAPAVEKWFPDLPELEAVFPAGTIDHSVEPIYPEVPKWEESILEARSRYASVIRALADKYPYENLLLVTHGEGVGASVSYFEMGLDVYDVEYCAYSVLERQVAKKPGDEQGAGSFKVLTKSGTTGIRYAPVSESWSVG